MSAVKAGLSVGHGLAVALVLARWAEAQSEPFVWAVLVVGTMLVVAFCATGFEQLVRHFSTDRRQSLALSFGAVAFAVLALVMWPLRVPTELALWARGTVVLSHAVALAGLFAALGARWLGHVEPKAQTSSGKTPKWVVPVATAVPVACWALWLAAFYPGLMTSDSTDQWAQSSSWAFSDWHPIGHTQLIGLLRTLFDSPAVVGLFQIGLMAAAVAWAAQLAVERGASAFAVVAGGVVIGLYPVTGTMPITVWKDVPFAIGAGYLSLLVATVAQRPGALSRRPGWYGALFISASLLAMLTRHNALPVVIGAAAAIVLLERQTLKLALVGLLAVLALTVGVRRAVAATHEVSYPINTLQLVGVLGAHVAGGTELTADEKEVLSSFRPLEDSWEYHCYSNVPTLFSPKANIAAVSKHARALRELALRLTLRNPKPVLRHIVCASALVWRINDDVWANGPAIGFNSPTEYTTIYPAPGAPKLASQWRALSAQLAELLRWSVSLERQWFFWRPALCLLVLLVGAALACLSTRSLKWAATLLPVVLHSAALALVVPSQDTRYQYVVYVVCLLLVPGWLSAPRLVRAEAPAVAPVPTPSAQPTVLPSPVADV